MTVVWLVVLAGLLIVQYLLLLTLMKVNWKHVSNSPTFLPKVSILVAARNEEESLPRLLKSIGQLDYPADLLEILIADDQSSDQTASLVADWASDFPNRRLISIGSHQVGRYQTNGKANALAIIAKEASGEFFFFTDADCEVPTSWIKDGVGSFEGEIGMVIGITQVKGVGFFAKMQELEWWNTLGIVKVVTDLNLPTTGLGNNMVISSVAYLACGGFESLRQSVTEDLEISRSVRSAGYRLCHQVTEGFLAKTKAEKDLKSLLDQRKRWVTGAVTLSIPWKILLGLQFLFFPFVIALTIFHWQLGLLVWGLKVLFQSGFLRIFAGKARQKIGLFSLLFFDFYQIVGFSLTILYYFWPSKVQWKSRSYP